MSLRTAWATLVGVLLLSPATAPAADPLPVASPTHVIVEWAAGASPSERRAAREGADVEFARDLGSRRFQLVETEPGQAPGEAVRDLEADPAVALAERDGLATTLAIPNDPLFGKLWGLQNTGLGIDGFVGAVPGADINVGSAWDRSLGSPTTAVAVIDSGYRFEHPDLANVAWANPGETLDGVDNDDNGIVDDVHGADFIGPLFADPAVDGDPTDDDMFTSPGGHGVHTAGTIGAEGNNGVGIVGVAQGVSLMPLRACVGIGCLTSTMIEAVNYAGAKGARVANISIGSENKSVALADAIAANSQTLFVIAAGNDGESNEVKATYPCVFNPVAEGRGLIDNVICVAATDQADQLADFSNWGVNTVDLGAPGTEVLSAAPYRYFIEDDFELDDFATRWTASGAGGGLFRTNEAPLSSFGITDSPGATPAPGVERASTSAPVTIPPGYGSCALELTSWSSGGFFEVLLDGENEFGFGLRNTGRTTRKLLSDLQGGGELAVRVSYSAGPNPTAQSGLWVDDIALHCIAKVGEADGYRFASGTSMAAPHVSGAAALLFSLRPGASVSEVRQGLLRSVDPVGSLAGRTTSGGRLDVGAAADLFDSTPPPTPSLSATNPASPATSRQPRLIGAAQRGTQVDVFTNASCSGAPAASGTAAQFAGIGIAVPVAADSATELSARANDLVHLSSSCSAPLAYQHKSPSAPPDPPGPGDDDPVPPGTGGDETRPIVDPVDPGTQPVAPTCRVPKLTGKPLAKARAALRAAHCRLGKVHRPRRSQGRPLVVKSSSPRPGASPASGKVDLTLRPKPPTGRPATK